MPAKSATIEKKLKRLGLSQEAVRAAWPAWWSAEAEFSPSAVNDLKFSVARKLGISPTSLFDEGDAVFSWDGDAKFKGLTAESPMEEKALVAFGTSISRLLIKATEPPAASMDAGISGSELREAIIRSGAPCVRLHDLIALAWAIGIPVVHLRIFPLTAKRMAAMTIRTGNRHAILIGRDSMFPANIAYYIAHELGHIFGGHLSDNSAIVDIDMPDEMHERDDEELAADSFALALLTGREDPEVTATRVPRNSRELAYAVINAGHAEAIDPGTLALCYAHRSGRWKFANNAMRLIYSEQKPVWKEINRYASEQLTTANITHDSLSFLAKVMGIDSNAENAD